MSNINKLDGISAVEDLTDAADAVVEGGGSNNGGTFNFDFLHRTKAFSVSRGETLALPLAVQGVEPLDLSLLFSKTQTLAKSQCQS